MNRRSFIGATGAAATALVVAVKPIQAIAHRDHPNKELFDVSDKDATYIVCVKDPDLKTMPEKEQMAYLMNAKKALVASGINAIVTCEDIEIFKIRARDGGWVGDFSNSDGTWKAAI